jgi:MFS family permease
MVSGILQGFYMPLIPDLATHLGINDADFHWFEAAQLLLSVMVVPLIAKLGDMHGHKRILLLATVLTAGATWWLAFTAASRTFSSRGHFRVSTLSGSPSRSRSSSIEGERPAVARARLEKLPDC